jgi:hypothetical protein
VLASVFAMPRWQRLALSPDRADSYYRFYDDISARALQATSIRAQPAASHTILSESGSPQLAPSCGSALASKTPMTRH